MNVHSLPTGLLQTNCFYFSNGKDVCIIDPGDEAERLLNLISPLGGSFIIILTHAHIDHIGAVNRLQQKLECPVYLDPDDNYLIEKFADQVSWLSALHLREESPGSITPLPSVIEAGGERLEVIKTPGHTKGSVSFYIERTGTLFSGDTLFAGSVGRWDLWGGSESDLLSSIKEKLLILPDETVVYPGHNGPTTIGEERKNNPFINLK